MTLFGIGWLIAGKFKTSIFTPLVSKLWHNGKTLHRKFGKKNYEFFHEAMIIGKCLFNGTWKIISFLPASHSLKMKTIIRVKQFGLAPQKW